MEAGDVRDEKCGHMGGKLPIVGSYIDTCCVLNLIHQISAAVFPAHVDGKQYSVITAKLSKSLPIGS